MQNFLDRYIMITKNKGTCKGGKMNRIAIVSDTHNKCLDETARLIKEYKAEYIIFLGDLYEDGSVLENKTFLDGISVLGNNDYMLYGKFSDEEIIDVNGYKIFICHGHTYKVEDDLSLLREKAEKEKFDICLFGHTHVYHEEIINGIYYYNPGSPSIAKYSYDPTSFGILDLNNKVKFEKIIVAPAK